MVVEVVEVVVVQEGVDVVTVVVEVVVVLEGVDVVDVVKVKEGVDVV